MAGLSKDNHFVPQGLLRQWSDDGKRIFGYRTLVSHAQVPEWQHCSIRGLASQEHLYTTVDSSSESDEFERWIEREFETPGLMAIQALVQGSRLSPADWQAMLKFTMLQDIRTPLHFLESVRRWHKEMPETLETVVRDVEAFAQLQRQPAANGESEHQALSTNPFEKSVRLRVEPASGPDAQHSVVSLEVPSRVRFGSIPCATF